MPVLASSGVRPAAPIAPAEYKLGGGDVIRIVVFQNPDLSSEVRVADSGIINFPLLGALRVGGQTVGAVEKMIAEGLRNGNFVKQPQVSVSLTQIRAYQASVLGQVNRPGRYAIETAELRLSELLAIAGGVNQIGADQAVITGMREGKPFRQVVDVPMLFGADGRARDLLIENGDTVYVERQPMVYIYGEVQRPGGMRLERDMTVLQTLAAGGGLTAKGTVSNIKLHRKKADGRVEVLEPKMDERVQEGDVLFLRESLF